ncbi:MAG TPA: hypothetical protein VF794_36655 [Archangium sp.]|jgi:hypothetical protein|uniref:anti-sigma factor family protein n=1 Tax=Archangium sp. TaxID=1872627 RepID=UPI002ED98B59
MSPPDFSKLRQGRPECPSDFTLDRLHAGELSREEAQEPERHVAGCADCGARMAERRAGFDGLPGVDPRVMLGRIRTGLDRPLPLPQRLLGWLRRHVAPLTMVATAAVALLLVTGQENVQPPMTRAKGSLALHVFRLVGDHAEEAVSGGTFAPGDRLRFTVDLPSEGFVTVLGVESSGALYTAWPLEPGTQTRFGEDKGIPLSGAVSLDEQPGRETLHLVHCPIEVGPPRCTSAGAKAAPVCPAGCVTTPFILVKGP